MMNVNTYPTSLNGVQANTASGVPQRPVAKIFGCVCRKPKPGSNDDEVRQGSRVIRIPDTLNRASDSLTSSTQIRFSVHTGAQTIGSMTVFLYPFGKIRIARHWMRRRRDGSIPR
jgi:hypothetical protein